MLKQRYAHKNATESEVDVCQIGARCLTLRPAAHTTRMKWSSSRRLRATFSFQSAASVLFEDFRPLKDTLQTEDFVDFFLLGRFSHGSKRDVSSGGVDQDHSVFRLERLSSTSVVACPTGPRLVKSVTDAQARTLIGLRACTPYFCVHGPL